jgi:hypothetical protein
MCADMNERTNRHKPQRISSSSSEDCLFSRNVDVNGRSRTALAHVLAVFLNAAPGNQFGRHRATKNEQNNYKTEAKKDEHAAMNSTRNVPGAMAIPSSAVALSVS